METTCPGTPTKGAPYSGKHNFCWRDKSGTEFLCLFCGLITTPEELKEATMSKRICGEFHPNGAKCELPKWHDGLHASALGDFAWK